MDAAVAAGGGDGVVAAAQPELPVQVAAAPAVVPAPAQHGAPQGGVRQVQFEGVDDSDDDEPGSEPPSNRRRTSGSESPAPVAAPAVAQPGSAAPQSSPSRVPRRSGHHGGMHGRVTPRRALPAVRSPARVTTTPASAVRGTAATPGSRGPRSSLRTPANAKRDHSPRQMDTWPRKRRQQTLEEEYR